MNAANSHDPGQTGDLDRGAQPMFHRVLRAQPLLVRDTLADIRRRFAADIDEDALGRLELVLAEVMNNVAEHGPWIGETGPDGGTLRAAPMIHICIVRHAGGLSCAVTDDGISLPDGCLLPGAIPDAHSVDLPEGGFGWFLIHDLTQELCYYREETRNFLAFRVPVSEDASSDPEKPAG
ncbi:ATP-binding protein [Paracoccus sp. M683]|uniref:ATP-binding protein n=1 Tax=Paracoccus sp. M683 TaxID=2594268 RepID=UPI00117DA992|nr:ATP-binding protein [Paracoccus sp. M683]TRW98720.1 ATP-binding protein [Paracoccus sp. M683]